MGNIGGRCQRGAAVHLDRTDLAGAYTRSLVTATSRLRMVYGFENNRLLPDNSWLILRTEWLNYQRSDMWMAKMLAVPGSGLRGSRNFRADVAYPEAARGLERK